MKWVGRKRGEIWLFKLAKEKLQAGEFSQVAGAVPDIEGLIAAAPKPDGFSGALGGLASTLGGSSNFGNLAALAGGFKGLNMNSGMINQFIPIVLSFVQSKGGDAIKGILAKILK